jgi:hypothetical protein
MKIRDRVRAAVDWCDDWRQSAGIGAALFVILAAVSAYYLVRWGHANGMPGLIAWALPAALDFSGYRAVLVARRARDDVAQSSAMTLVWCSVGLSMLGNIGSHAVDAGLLRPNFWTMAATVSVIPLMAIWGHIVGGGISARPEVRRAADELDETRAALAAATARAEAAERERDELRARKRPPRTPAPPAEPKATGPVPVPSPEARHAKPDPAPKPPPYTPAQLEKAIEYLVLNPGKGRRAVVSGIGGGIGDNPSKTLHKDALAAIEALPEHAVMAIRERAEGATVAA